MPYMMCDLVTLLSPDSTVVSCPSRIPRSIKSNRGPDQPAAYAGKNLYIQSPWECRSQIYLSSSKMSLINADLKCKCEIRQPKNDRHAQTASTLKSCTVIITSPNFMSPTLQSKNISQENKVHRLCFAQSDCSGIRC